MNEKTVLPKWKVFDLEWYNSYYKTFSILIKDIYRGDVFAYYTQNGYKIGHSPNPYFDEKWYLKKYPEVVELIRNGKYRSGFDHYCQKGYETNSPHWLFSEIYYKEHYPDLSSQIGPGKRFLNGYDHYLQVGDSACYKGSFFFNPKLYLSQKENVQEIIANGPFQYLLKQSRDDFDQLRLSWYFDPGWYLDHYPDVLSLNAGSKSQNSLYHYLTNDTPTAFSPLESFSEEFYYHYYKDLVKSIPPDGRGIFRNGYEHFIVCGCNEGRKPNENFSYDQFSKEIRETVKTSGTYDNLFEYWLAHQCPDLLSKMEKVEIEWQNTQGQETVVVQGDRRGERGDASQESQGISMHEETVDIPQTGGPSGQDSILKNEVPQDSGTVLSENQENIRLDDKPESESKQGFGPFPKELSCLDQLYDLPPLNKGAFFITASPLWKEFDEEWYVRKYTDVPSRMKVLEVDNIKEYHFSFGCYEGYSPNPYFDEMWYLEQYPNVRLMVERHEFTSGFDHYCKVGYQDHAPHWLFSETYYRKMNLHLTDENLERNGFLNGYDHYLKVGETEGISGSPFFDGYFFMGQYHEPIYEGMGPYRYYLKHLNQIDGLIKTSWYFDPEWYSQAYPDVKQLIDKGEYDNYLHHYLTNKQKFDYCPSAWFDEKFYDSKYYETLTDQDAFKKYRNGYDHFIHEGIGLLWRPSPTVDLKSYELRQNVQKDLKEHLYPNIYVHWLATHQELKDLSLDAEDKIDPAENQVHPKALLQDALWFAFDKEWYLKRYWDTQDKMEICGIDDVETYYQQVGSALGHSPNPYFHEEWYLYTYPEVDKQIQRGVYGSGFEHYCKQGYLTHNPHWLFSNAYYLRNSQDFVYDILNDPRFVNGYDHFLKKGDGLLRSGSIFFDPLVYQRKCYQKGNFHGALDPYKTYLNHLFKEDQNSDVSLYFDMVWYIGQYPEVREAIGRGEYECALHHYLVNKTPHKFDPSPWFSESFYLQTYPDLHEAISGKDSSFRNGYDHFVLYGSLERRQPHPDVDLNKYYFSGTVREDIENGLYRDAFAHFVFDKRLQAWLAEQPKDSTYHLSHEAIQSKKYFQNRSRVLVATVAHQKLDFSYEGEPEISVIMLMHNHLSVTLTALASLRVNFRGKIQLLLGDNHSTDDSRYLQNSLIGAEITRFPYNLGFGKACNYLMKKVNAPFILFLNNDLNLFPGAVDGLCHRLRSSKTIGAVGGKIVFPDGTLQEAGQIIWRDGTTSGYLRGKDPLLPEANFVRDVDYCSAAMLAVKTEIMQELGGFSPLYFPAYFEDTDLCVRIIEAGYRVVYDPDAVVEHMEYASSDPMVSHSLIHWNHRKFVKEHADFLRFQCPRHSNNILIARQRRSKKKKRILVIEDRVPLRYLGSGYVRSNDVIRGMVELGYEVMVYPVNGYYPHPYQIYSDIPKTVEVLFNNTVDQISEFFRERAGYYDLVWIGRTHNLDRILPMMGEANRYLPQDCLILDTEVIAAPRARLHAQLLGRHIDQTLEEAVETELACARHCQQIVTVNEIDADYARNVGFDNVNILGHMVPSRPTQKTWSERRDILFVGALHDELSPNYDSLQWFLANVMPILVQKMEMEFTFSVVGYVSPSVNMASISQYPHVRLLGMVQDLTELYNSHRVYVAPTRFAGGIPYKLHEAASYGIPVVASDLLVQQLGWQDDVDILAASVTMPDFFASQIMRLYQTESLWNEVRQNALCRIENECGQERFRDGLKRILSKVILHK